MIRRCIVVLLALVALAGCSSSSGSKTPGKYDQTWRGSYKTLTCAQWLHEMTADQRFVASHDFVIALKARDTSDSFARSFVVNISRDCEPVQSLKVAEVAAALATIDTNDFS